MAEAEPPPKIGKVRPSHLYLEQLQKAAYAELGYPAPTFNAESLLRRKVQNLYILREGGEYEIELKKSLKENGLDEA